MKRRVYQVAEKIREVVAGELLHASDPRFNLVTITSVVISPDLRHAKIYWMVSGDESRREEVSEAFQGASGKLKFHVGKSLELRCVPDLKFFYDDTLDATEEVERLLARARNSSNGQS